MSTGGKEPVLSAGVVIVRPFPDGPKLLLLRAYNYWDFPKGLVEPGEDPIAAALREAVEEAGLRKIELPWGEAFRETEPYGRNKVARYYIGLSEGSEEVHLPVSPELGRPEHHEFRWLSIREARATVVSRLVPIVEWAQSVIGSGH